MKELGILDPNGLEKNPLTGVEYTPEYVSFSINGDNSIGALPWTKYPVYEKRYEFIKAIHESQVVMVVSGTGSGKSVLVPKFALHVLDYKGRVVLTNPKTLATYKNAQYAALCLDVELGKQVGYHYRGAPEGSYNKSETKLLFATDGMLVAQILNDPIASKIDCIIIDEAHERGVQIDYLLLLVKRALIKRPDLKLIIMSATIDKTVFSKYFKQFKYTEIDAGTVPNFPIKEFFVNKPCSNYIDCGTKIIEKLVSNKKAILMFVTSKVDGNKGCISLSKSKDVYCIVLARGSPDQEYAIDESKFKEICNCDTKVVMSTNIAESSVTVKGLYYVIESGLANIERFDPVKKQRILEKVFISKAQHLQRKGRAGRTSTGECYNLFTQEQYKKFNDYPLPDILKIDITDDILRFMTMKDVQTVKNTKDMLGELIQPPKESFVKYGMDTLKGLEVITNNRVNLLGYIASRLRTTVQCAIALIRAEQAELYDEVSTIVSMLEVSDNRMDTFFQYPNKVPFGQVLAKHQIFLDKKGDLLSLYNLYTAFTQQSDQQSWCKSHYVNFKKLNKINNIRKNFIHTIKQLKPKIDRLPKNESIKDINDCFLEGYKLNIIKNNKNIHSKSSINLLRVKFSKAFFVENMKVMNKSYYNIIGIIK